MSFGKRFGMSLSNRFFMNVAGRNFNILRYAFFRNILNSVIISKARNLQYIFNVTFHR